MQYLICYNEGSFQFDTQEFTGSLSDAKKIAIEHIEAQFKYRASAQSLWATFTPAGSDFDIFKDRVVMKGGVWCVWEKK